MRVNTLRKLVVHLNIGGVFFIFAARDLIHTTDLFHNALSSMFGASIYPLYPFMLILTIMNLVTGGVARVVRSDLILSTVKLTHSLALLYLFLLLQVVNAIFSVDLLKTLSIVLTYFFLLTWSYSLLFILEGRYKEFNQLIINYWIYCGLFVAVLSLILYLVGYTPVSSVYSAVVFEIDSLVPGFPAMRGALNIFDTTIFVTVAAFLYAVKSQSRHLAYLVLFSGFLIVLMMMKRTGLVLYGSGAIVLGIFSLYERRFLPIIFSVLFIFVGMWIYSDLLMYYITSGDTQTSLKVSSRGHVLEIINDSLNNVPILGYGFGATDKIVNTYTGGDSQADSSYVTLLAGTGISGLLLYTAWLLILLKSLMVRLASGQENITLEKSNVILLVFFLTVSLSTDWINNISVGLPFVIFLIVSSIRKPLRYNR